MALEADEKYTVEVVSAYNGNSKEKGTPALFFTFKTTGDDPSFIDHALWISPATVDRTIKTMDDCFGITVEQLGDPAFLSNFESHVKGKQCSITTEAEEYNGDEYVKVKWMNSVMGRKERVISPGVESKTAQLFRGMGGVKTAPATARRGSVPLDDDVPF